MVLVFLAVFFGPSGLYLLWQFPAWETMQVAASKDDLPAWLVVLFAVTNITQGILGYWVGYKLIRAGNTYGAHVNWMVAWILFWFILVCGWDTTGWQRFLYDSSMVGGTPWQPGLHMDLAFFTSHVFITLAVMGLGFAPMLILGIVVTGRRALAPGAAAAGREIPSYLKIFSRSLGVMFTVCLSAAIAIGQLVAGIVRVTGSMLTGYLLGLGLAVAVGYGALFRRNQLVYKLLRPLFLPSD